MCCKKRREHGLETWVLLCDQVKLPNKDHLGYLESMLSATLSVQLIAEGEA